MGRDGDIFGRRGAGTGRVAERASRRESATRPALIFDELATMPRVLRSEAHADALREWTLAEACYSWSRYVASDNDATSAAGPDDECPCAGAARNEEYLVSCDPVRLTPPSRRTTSRAFPSRPPANVTETFAPSLFARHRHFIPFPSSDAEAERRRDARATAPVPSSPSRRPRPFRRDPHPGNTPPLPPERLLIQEATGYHLPETPSSSPQKTPSDDAFIFFVVAFACIIAACVASLAVVHRWWRREAAALEAERAARAAASNPWNMRATRADGAEGSGKSERLGGSVVRGLMYGLYVLNPSGSFSFAIEKVVTNTSAEKSAKLRGEEDAAATESGEAATDAASGEAATTADAFESESAADSETVPRGSVDPWDAVPSRADSGTTRDENEGRVRGARRGVGFAADGGTR